MKYAVYALTIIKMKQRTLHTPASIHVVCIIVIMYIDIIQK